MILSKPPRAHSDIVVLARMIPPAALILAIAVASVSSGAHAQSSNLPPVTVDAPTARPRPAAKPTPDQVRARDALRRAARRSAQPSQAAAVPYPNAGGLRADRDPYADPAAPYKVDHLEQSGKFPEPILNTPKSGQPYGISLRLLTLSLQKAQNNADDLEDCAGIVPCVAVEGFYE